MIVSTFNIQNDYSCYDKSKADIIYKYLKDNHIDVLGLQEVFSKCNNDPCNLFKDNYQMIGNYRFISKILLNRFNEKNPIITREKILSYKTYNLPFLPSVVKRVITHVVIEHKGKEISIYNTHLEVRNLNVKKRQLKMIYDLLLNDPREKILMGDFNLKNNNFVFLNFINALESIGMKRIVFGEKTLKASKYSREIDHIFISDDIEVINKKVVKDLSISDHYPVIIDINI